VRWRTRPDDLAYQLSAKLPPDAIGNLLGVEHAIRPDFYDLARDDVANGIVARARGHGPCRSIDCSGDRELNLNDIERLNIAFDLALRGLHLVDRC